MTVSVVIPTHNRPRLLREALESVTAQTIDDYEIIVVSNGETYGNLVQVSDICAKFGAELIVLPEGNVSAARNTGIHASSGHWIAFLDDDDLWKPNKLDRQLRMASITGADVIFCSYEVTWADGRVTQHTNGKKGWSWAKALMLSNYVGAGGSGTMVRTTVAHLHPFDEKLKYGEDWDAWRRYAYYFEASNVPEPLVMIRKHDGNKSDEWRHHWYTQRVRLKMFTDTPPHLWLMLPLVAWQLVQFFPLLIRLYLFVNRLTGGLSGRTWRWFKGRFA